MDNTSIILALTIVTIVTIVTLLIYGFISYNTKQPPNPGPRPEPRSGPPPLPHRIRYRCEDDQCVLSGTSHTLDYCLKKYGVRPHPQQYARMKRENRR